MGVQIISAWIYNLFSTSPTLKEIVIATMKEVVGTLVNLNVIRSKECRSSKDLYNTQVSETRFWPTLKAHFVLDIFNSLNEWDWVVDGNRYKVSRMR